MSARERVQQLARESYDRGDPIGWFDRVYQAANGDESQIPWSALRPSPHLTRWLDSDHEKDLTEAGTDSNTADSSALVIAVGLGDDAERIASSGFRVTAFDISQTAIDWAHRRFPASEVQYAVADLLDPPAAWEDSFNFVFETQTLQALPWTLRSEAVKRISSFVAPGGTLLVVTLGRDEQEAATQLPWPLTRSELDGFRECGLVEQSFVDETDEDAKRWFIVTYQKPKKVSA